MLETSVQIRTAGGFLLTRLFRRREAIVRDQSRHGTAFCLHPELHESSLLVAVGASWAATFGHRQSVWGHVDRAAVVVGGCVREVCG